MCAVLSYPPPEPLFPCLYLHVERGAARSTGTTVFFGSIVTCLPCLDCIRLGGQPPSVGKDCVHRIRCIHIYYHMERSLIPKLPCMCGNLRRTSRALTQLYENALGCGRLSSPSCKCSR